MNVAPMVTSDFDGWRVSIIQNGRAQVYLCASQAAALKFAAVLAQPVVEPRRSSRKISFGSRRGWADRLLRVAGL